MAPDHAGLDATLKHPLFQALFSRRSGRITQGLKSVPAGSLSYESHQDPQPLTPLEEAVLIAATGATGLTMPDRPFQESPNGLNILGTPNIHMPGRAAGSPDNAQA